ncbi:MAG TPA: hypothetical protein VMH03_01145 [Terriglobales bacterium]|nr:hypothetical protein [Terriglobales bacterium]
MDISTYVVALLVSAQVLKERIALTGFRDGKHLVHRWRDDPLAACPKYSEWPSAK